MKSRGSPVLFRRFPLFWKRYLRSMKGFPRTRKRYSRDPVAIPGGGGPLILDLNFRSNGEDLNLRERFLDLTAKDLDLTLLRGTNGDFSLVARIV